MYKIKRKQLINAKKLGVTIKPSKSKNKKLDVFKNNKKIASIGAKGYGDYATYIQTRGLKVALERKRLYKRRHERFRKIKGTNSYYADQILWT